MLCGIDGISEVITASRTAGQENRTAVGLARTITLVFASANVQATPTWSCPLTSQIRTTAGAPSVAVHVSSIWSPVVQLRGCAVGGAKPQLRLGPSCPRVHSSVTKLPPGELTCTSP